MPLVNMRDMLQQAYNNHYAVGVLDFLEAIMSATEVKRSPVNLSLAESHFEHYDFKPAMAAAELTA